MLKNRVLLTAYAILAFFTVLAGDFWRYLLSWYGWGAIIGIVTAFGVILIVRQRDRWRLNNLPYPLLALVAVALLSTAWSAYPGFTIVAAVLLLLTVVSALALAVTFTLTRVLTLLGHALRIILAGSLLFELAVSVFVRHPVLPWWEHYSGKIPMAYYWSRDLLFHGDRIQGLMGNSNLLGFVALLGLIVFAIEFAGRSIHRGAALGWLVVAAANVALTRSATVVVVGVVVALVAIAIVLLRRAATPRGRTIVGATSTVLALGLVIIAIVNRTAVAGLLDRSSSFTGRSAIWNEVIRLAGQRPVGGWGWISYWYPGIAPFNNRAFTIGGVHYLQAHNAWLDIGLQLGIVGLIILIALALSTLVRAWSLAVDRPTVSTTSTSQYSIVTMLPVLLLVALLVQSFAESRLLIEYGMLLLAFIAIITKRPDLGARPPTSAVDA